MFLIQYNLLTESTFNDTIEKVGFVGFGGKNQYVSGNCLYVLHIRKVLFDLYQQRYECFLRIMDYFFCFCNKEYVFLNH